MNPYLISALSFIFLFNAYIINAITQVKEWVAILLLCAMVCIAITWWYGRPEPEGRTT